MSQTRPIRCRGSKSQRRTSALSLSFASPHPAAILSVAPPSPPPASRAMTEVKEKRSERRPGGLEAAAAASSKLLAMERWRKTRAGEGTLAESVMQKVSVRPSPLISRAPRGSSCSTALHRARSSIAAKGAAQRAPSAASAYLHMRAAVFTCGEGGVVQEEIEILAANTARQGRVPKAGKTLHAA